MPIRVEWEDETRICLRHTVSIPWGADDIRAATLETARLVAAEAHRVDIVVDARLIESLPPGAMAQMRFIEAMLPPNTGYIVVVSRDASLRTVVKYVGDIIPKFAQDLYFVGTLDDATALLDDLTKRDAGP